MSTYVNEKIILKDVFVDTPIENKEMYNIALKNVLNELGVIGIRNEKHNTNYPIIYLKDYLYSRLYSKICNIEIVHYLNINMLQFNHLEIEIIGSTK